MSRLIVGSESVRGTSFGLGWINATAALALGVMAACGGSSSFLGEQSNAVRSEDTNLAPADEHKCMVCVAAADVPEGSRTIVVPEEEKAEHLARGAALGPCRAGQGPHAEKRPVLPTCEATPVLPSCDEVVIAKAGKAVGKGKAAEKAKHAAKVAAIGHCAENGKVAVCHIPPGNPANAHTIVISVNALKAHIGRHGGDYLGFCSRPTCEAAPVVEDHADEHEGDGECTDSDEASTSSTTGETTPTTDPVAPTTGTDPAASGNGGTDSSSSSTGGTCSTGCNTPVEQLPPMDATTCPTGIPSCNSDPDCPPNTGYCHSGCCLQLVLY